MARGDTGTRILDLEVNVKTVHSKPTRMDLKWAVPLLSERKPIELGLQAYFGQNSRCGSFRNWKLKDNYVFNNCLVCAQQHGRHFTYVILFNLPHNPVVFYSCPRSQRKTVTETRGEPRIYRLQSLTLCTGIECLPWKMREGRILVPWGASTCACTVLDGVGPTPWE